METTSHHQGWQALNIFTIWKVNTQFCFIWRTLINFSVFMNKNSSPLFTIQKLRDYEQLQSSYLVWVSQVIHLHLVCREERGEREEVWPSFTTNLSGPDQNCIQLMSVGGLDTSKGSSPTSSLQGQLARALVREDDLVSYKENIWWGIMLWG